MANVKLNDEKTKNAIQKKSYAFALRIIAAGQSRADFLSKMAIASKEARETHYWLRLIRDGKIMPEAGVTSLLVESEELVKILASIVKTTSASK